MSEPSPAPRPSGWSAARHLVYFGQQITWRSSVSDFQMNSALAERWEPAVDTARGEGRSFILGIKSEGYGIRLRDGAAAFRVESEAAYERSLAHTHELLESLQDSRRSRQLALSLQAQYLVPTDEPFEDVVKRLHGTLYNYSLADAFGAEISDLAYLADFRRDDMRFQVSIGSVRSHEIRQRVIAEDVLPELYDVAIFWNLAVFRAVPKSVITLSGFSDAAFEIGETVARGLGL